MLLLVLISFALIVDGFEYRRCLLYQGICVPHCPLHMHPYHTRCDRDTMSQRTCDNPETFGLGYTCGWSRCDCNGDHVLDETTGQCMEALDCPEARHIRKKSSARRNLEPKRKRILYTEGEMPETE